jgi:hypothetical protein
MGTFLVELYVADRAAVARGVELTRRAAEDLTRSGTPVRHVRSIFVPEDETCFFLYEAESAEAVDRAASESGLPFERVSHAVSSPERS